MVLLDVALSCSLVLLDVALSCSLVLLDGALSCSLVLLDVALSCSLVLLDVALSCSLVLLDVALSCSLVLLTKNNARALSPVGARSVKWESLYSPMLKYGSYRSRDPKLRHRERCVRERPGRG